MVSLTAIVIRISWVFLTGYLPCLVRSNFRSYETRPEWRIERELDLAELRLARTAITTM